MGDVRAGDSIFFPAEYADEGAVKAWDVLQLVLPKVPLSQKISSPAVDFFSDRPSGLHVIHWNIIPEVDRFMEQVVRPRTEAAYFYEPQSLRAAACRPNKQGKDKFQLAWPLCQVLGQWTLDHVLESMHMHIKGEPDVSAFDSEHSCTLLIGDVERPENLPPLNVEQMVASMVWNSGSCFWAAISRLREHMILSNAAYGFVHTGDYTWFVGRIFPDQIGHLVVSDAVPRAKASLGCFWYLMYCALNLNANDGEVHNLSSVATPVQRNLDRPTIQERLRSMVKETAACFVKFKSKDRHEQLQFWWSLEEDFVWPDATSPYSNENIVRMACTVLRVVYKQQHVVVKLRDLSSKHCASFEDNLKIFVREILAYKHLKKLQGDAIPKLIDFGFTSGYLFGVLVLSECGLGFDYDFQSPPASRTVCSDTAAAQLRKVHALGLYHGDLDDKELVVMPPLKMSIVSLSRAGFISDLKSPSRFLARELERVRVLAGDTQVPDVSEPESGSESASEPGSD